MAVDTGELGHRFNINEVSIRLVPEGRASFNELDSFGTFLGLERLPEEKNREYKKRLMDVYVHRANSTYSGLLSGITRELGLELYQPVTFELVTIPSTSIPSISFMDNMVVVYEDVTTGLEELRVDRSSPTGRAYRISDLIIYINDNSSFFTATLNAGMNDSTRSDCILNGASVEQILGERLPASSTFKLKNSNILKNTLGFSDVSTFREEVASENLVTSAGKYFVDYETGFVAAFSLPAQGTVARYKHQRVTFSPTASPVIIRNLQSEEFKAKMFEQIVGEDGIITQGIPTDFGAEIINELLTVVPVYWGV